MRQTGEVEMEILMTRKPADKENPIGTEKPLDQKKSEGVEELVDTKKLISTKRLIFIYHKYED